MFRPFSVNGKGEEKRMEQEKYVPLVRLSMDNRQRPLAVEIISIGTVDMAPVNPREIFKHAILVSAANIIVIP